MRRETLSEALKIIDGLEPLPDTQSMPFFMDSGRLPADKHALSGALFIGNIKRDPTSTHELLEVYKSRLDTEIKDLALVMIYEGLHSIRKLLVKGKESDRDSGTGDEALGWVFSDSDHAYSFVWCCQIANIDPDYIRRLIIEIEDGLRQFSPIGQYEFRGTDTKPKKMKKAA